MRVKGEGFSQASSSHRDKGHGIDEAQQPLTAREQQIEPCLLERLVYPDHLDERREIGTKGSDRVQTKPPADECVSFNKNEREIVVDPVILGEIRFGILRLRPEVTSSCCW
jgi:hypothetical protein